MTALAPTRSPLSDVLPSAEQHFVLNAVSWEQYEAIGEIFRDRPNLRLTFDRGTLELMTTSHEHERHKRWLARLVETMAEEFGKPIATYGSATFKQALLDRGFEPDDCFWIAHEREMRGKLTWEPERDPPPDLTLEIEVSRSAINRMGIFTAFAFPRCGGSVRPLRLLAGPTGIPGSAANQTFPGVPLQELLRSCDRMRQMTTERHPFLAHLAAGAPGQVVFENIERGMPWDRRSNVITSASASLSAAR